MKSVDHFSILLKTDLEGLAFNNFFILGRSLHISAVYLSKHMPALMVNCCVGSFYNHYVGLTQPLTGQLINQHYISLWQLWWKSNVRAEESFQPDEVKSYTPNNIKMPRLLAKKYFDVICYISILIIFLIFCMYVILVSPAHAGELLSICLQ